MMDIQAFDISGPLLITPRVFGDDRGYFCETFNAKAFLEATGTPYDFVQDNQSMSAKSVLRGLHYQLDPMAQGKLVRVVAGAVWDVAVDIRKSSSTFGQFVAAELTADNHKQLWIPPGFAHGFLTLTDQTIFQYKVTQYWSKEHERAIVWNDSELDIPWPFNIIPTVSDKDSVAAPFSQADYFV